MNVRLRTGDAASERPLTTCLNLPQPPETQGYPYQTASVAGSYGSGEGSATDRKRAGGPPE